MRVITQIWVTTPDPSGELNCESIIIKFKLVVQKALPCSLQKWPAAAATSLAVDDEKKTTKKKKKEEKKEEEEEGGRVSCCWCFSAFLIGEWRRRPSYVEQVMDEDVEIRERLFHNVVREYVVSFSPSRHNALPPALSASHVPLFLPFCPPDFVLRTRKIPSDGSKK